MGASLLLSRPEAAREIGVSTVTLDKLIARGELEVARSGRRVLVTRSSLERWVRAHIVAPATVAGAPTR